MNSKFIILLATVLMLTSCGVWHGDNNIAHRSRKPYIVKGRKYYPSKKARIGYTERGTASWYGKKFHGKKTSSGERFNMHRVSAAHKTLPLGTYIEVHNLKNDKTLTVRINDRGPFIGGRIIDLSYGAAQKLGCDKHGIVPVEITVVNPPLFEIPTFSLWDYL